MPSFSRRLFLASTLATLGGNAAPAQNYPTRPLRIVVPFAAGVPAYSTSWPSRRPASRRQPRAAGGDRQPARRGRHRRRRGRGQGRARRLSFDPLIDFVPVTMVNAAPLLLVVNPSVPVQSVQELIAYAKVHPGQLNYGSGGVGSTPYLATELLKSMTGIDVVHVPYKGGAPALADLMAGQLAFMIENVPGTLPLMSRASSARSRSPALVARP